MTRQTAAAAAIENKAIHMGASLHRVFPRVPLAWPAESIINAPAPPRFLPIRSKWRACAGLAA
jgi:hypothetical protein